jgi:hypothetical protein
MPLAETGRIARPARASETGGPLADVAAGQRDETPVERAERLLRELLADGPRLCRGGVPDDTKERQLTMDVHEDAGGGGGVARGVPAGQ